MACGSYSEAERSEVPQLGADASSCSTSAAAVGETFCKEQVIGEVCGRFGTCGVRSVPVSLAYWRNQVCDPNLAPSGAASVKDRLISSASCRRH
jgi:hypothetical protein